MISLNVFVSWKIDCFLYFVRIENKKITEQKGFLEPTLVAEQLWRSDKRVLENNLVIGKCIHIGGPNTMVVIPKNAGNNNSNGKSGRRLLLLLFVLPVHVEKKRMKTGKHTRRVTITLQAYVIVCRNGTVKYITSTTVCQGKTSSIIPSTRDGGIVRSHHD